MTMFGFDRQFCSSPVLLMFGFDRQLHFMQGVSVEALRTVYDLAVWMYVQWWWNVFVQGRAPSKGSISSLRKVLEGRL